ncbi:MAG: HdeD family acid-resistance protein [Halocynthiibacter sp.]
MESDVTEKFESSVQAAIAEHRTLFIVMAVLLIVLGTVAIIFPILMTLAAKIFLGWLLLISGVVQIYHAFTTKKWSQFFLNLLIGVMYAFVGGWLAFLPLAGIISLTLLLSFTFILQGVLETGMSLRLRPAVGWGWMMFSGITSAAVGVMIIAKLPSSALWAIGLLVGVNMITSGWAFLALALAAGKLARSQGK